MTPVIKPAVATLVLAGGTLATAIVEPSNSVWIAAIGAVAAIAATIGTIIVAAIQYSNNNKATAKQEEIHVLVNSRLTEALNEIAVLKSVVEKLEGPPAKLGLNSTTGD